MMDDIIHHNTHANHCVYPLFYPLSQRVGIIARESLTVDIFLIQLQVASYYNCNLITNNKGDTELCGFVVF